MASLHMQNSDDYRGGKFETSASVKERAIFLWGRVRVAFALKQNLLRGRGTKYYRHPISSVTQLQPFANIVQTVFKDFFTNF